jgi:hypothetical protein
MGDHAPESASNDRMSGTRDRLRVAADQAAVLVRAGQSKSRPTLVEVVEPLAVVIQSINGAIIDMLTAIEHLQQRVDDLERQARKKQKRN